MKAASPAERTAAPAATARLFFALWPPAGVAGRLHAVAAQCAERAGGRLMRRDSLHLTLAFLGNLPAAEIDALRDIAGRLAAPRFSLALDRLGVWRRQRIVWAGCAPESLPAGLPGLAATLAEALRAAGYGLETRAFVPHVTLLRGIAPTSDGGARSALPELPAIIWPADEFVLVRSATGGAPGSYTVLARWPLHPE